MNAKDAKLLRRYSKHMYRRGIRERQEESDRRSEEIIPPKIEAPPWYAEVAIRSDGHKKLVKWWDGRSAPERATARAQMRRELDAE